MIENLKGRGQSKELRTMPIVFIVYPTAVKMGRIPKANKERALEEYRRQSIQSADMVQDPTPCEPTWSQTGPLNLASWSSRPTAHNEETFPTVKSSQHRLADLSLSVDTEKLAVSQVGLTTSVSQVWLMRFINHRPTPFIWRKVFWIISSVCHNCWFGSAVLLELFFCFGFPPGTDQIELGSMALWTTAVRSEIAPTHI